MLELFKIAGKIDLEGVDKAEKDLGRIDKKAGGFGSKFGGVAKTVGKAGLAIGAATAAAGAGAFAMVEKVTASFDSISKGAQRLGVTTKAYQEMDFWASQNGISHQQMEKIVGRFNQRMGMAQNGNEKYSEALKQLNVDMDAVKDGTLSTDDAFAQSIKTLSEMENQQDQVNLATEMFGVKTARDLLPALQDGSLSMEEAKQKAQELGIVIGEDSLNAAVKFQDTWDRLKRTFTAVSQSLMAELMPVFQTMMDWVLANMPTIKAVFKTAFDVIGAVVGTVVEVIKTVIGWFTTFYETTKETTSGIWTAINEGFTQIRDFILTIWEGIKTFFQQNSQAIRENFVSAYNAIKDTVITVFNTVRETITTVLQSVWEIIQTIWQSVKEYWQTSGQEMMTNAQETFQAIRDAVQTAFEYAQQIIQQVLGYVVPFIQEQLARIQQFWEQNGEQIMQAVENAFKFIQAVIEFVMPTIQNIIENAWNIISAVFEAAVGIIMGIVQTLAGLLTGDFESIKEGLTTIWESLWSGIQGVVEGAWGLLSGAFSTLWGSIEGWFGDLKDDALDWGKNMLDGFVEGIRSKISDVQAAASDAVSAAGDFIKFWSPAKKGEGRYIRHWGRNMIDGFLDGVRDEEDNAGKAMENVVKRMNPGELNLRTNIGSRGVLQSRNDPAETTTNNNSNVTINNTFQSNQLTPSEVARKEKQAWRRAAMGGAL